MKKILALVICMMVVLSNTIFAAGVLYTTGMESKWNQSIAPKTGPNVATAPVQTTDEYYFSKTDSTSDISEITTTIPVLPNNVYGIDRFAVVMARAGNNAQIKDIKKITDTKWIATVESDKFWANGDWELTLHSDVPDVTGLKNYYYFGYYTDETLQHREGYVLAIKK